MSWCGYPVRTECGHARGGQDLQTHFFTLCYPVSKLVACLLARRVGTEDCIESATCARSFAAMPREISIEMPFAMGAEEFWALRMDRNFDVFCGARDQP